MKDPFLLFISGAFVGYFCSLGTNYTAAFYNFTGDSISYFGTGLSAYFGLTGDLKGICCGEGVFTGLGSSSIYLKVFSSAFLKILPKTGKIKFTSFAKSKISGSEF